MKTPMEQLIVVLKEAYDSNPMYPEYREGLAEAIGLAKGYVELERGHLREAWRDGANGIVNQTAEQYLREVYGG